MNIAIMSHTKKQDLMVQFCTAYCGILSKHTVCATNATGRMVMEATGLPVNLFLSHEHGGIEQIGQRIIIMRLTWCCSSTRLWITRWIRASSTSPGCVTSTPCPWPPTWPPPSCSFTGWPGATWTGGRA